ncbi:MAG: TIGR04211 family SH3 domain-containing protein [Magnetococcales bacterium]|nr:TIGR04211 family SH3 domain-containing protein [Magnetococcales bacterium]
MVQTRHTSLRFSPLPRWKAALLVSGALFIAGAAWAENRFVSENCTITLRRGQGLDFKIIRELKTGTPLTVLEKAGSGWTRVQTADGTDGWLLDRYLGDEPPPRALVDGAAAARRKAEEERDRFTKENHECKTRLATLQGVEAEFSELRRLSGDTLAMAEENKKLNALVKELEEKVVGLEEEVQQMEQSSDTRFFLAGAGVLLLGMIGGAMMGRRRRRPYDML